MSLVLITRYSKCLCSAWHTTTRATEARSEAISSCLEFFHYLTLLEHNLQNHSFIYLAETLQTPLLGNLAGRRYENRDFKIHRCCPQRAYTLVDKNIIIKCKWNMASSLRKVWIKCRGWCAREAENFWLRCDVSEKISH